MRTKKGYSRLETGFKAIDNRTGGLRLSELFIVGSRPGMGKTDFILNLIANIAVRDEFPVGFFSFEAPELTTYRLISILLGVETDKLYLGEMTEESHSEICETLEIIAMKLDNNLVKIEDEPGLSIDEVCDRARQMHEENNVSCIFIDYMQLIGEMKGLPKGFKGGMATICKELKALALELDVSIVCSVMLSRLPENRDDHRPVMSDLYEHEAMERYSDEILLLYRDNYYNKAAPNDELEVIISQDREVTLKYDRETGSLLDKE